LSAETVKRFHRKRDTVGFSPEPPPKPYVARLKWPVEAAGEQRSTDVASGSVVFELRKFILVASHFSSFYTA
jgi:hypothetical protein